MEAAAKGGRNRLQKMALPEKSASGTKATVLSVQDTVKSGYSGLHDILVMSTSFARLMRPPWSTCS